MLNGLTPDSDFAWLDSSTDKLSERQASPDPFVELVIKMRNTDKNQNSLMTSVQRR